MSVSFAPLTLLQPPRIGFGPGCAETGLRDWIDRGFRCIALVATKRAASQLAPFCASLEKNGLEVISVNDLPPEPTVEDFARVRASLRGKSFDAVVGCGGGSVLDVAKLLAALDGREEPVQAFFGSGLLPRRSTYLACLPTTSGSGSEVSPNAILLDEAAGLKKAVISPHLVPDAAYIDPTFTLSAPPALTAATGIDALVHCLEAFANRRAHPAIDTYALEGIRLIAANLPTAVHDGQNLQARSAVALGSLYGGLCLGPVNTAGVHALAYPLGSVFHIAHGLANALMLVPVLRFNLSAAPERYAAIALALGVSARSTPEATAAAGLDALQTLNDACALPRGLRSCGVTEKNLPTLVAGAMQVTRLLQNNPREITASDAAAIFQDALK